MPMCGDCEMQSRTGTGPHGDSEHCSCYWEGKAAAEAANKALVEALREIVKVGTDLVSYQVPDRFQFLAAYSRADGIARTALATHEERSKATCFRFGECKQPRNHEGPCDDWIVEK